MNTTILVQFVLMIALTLFSTVLARDVCFRAPVGAYPIEILTGSRESSAPYISGDTFRAFCDFIIDEKESSFYPAHVKDGDIIFVKTDFVDFFFTNIHPHIYQRYI